MEVTGNTFNLITFSGAMNRFIAHRRQSRSSSPLEAGSLAQALQDGAQQNRIGAVLCADQHPARKLDINRSSRRCRYLFCISAHIRACHGDRNQGGAGLTQFAALERATPLEINSSIGTSLAFQEPLLLKPRSMPTCLEIQIHHFVQSSHWSIEAAIPQSRIGV